MIDWCHSGGRRAAMPPARRPPRAHHDAARRPHVNARWCARRAPGGHKLQHSHHSGLLRTPCFNRVVCCIPARLLCIVRSSLGSKMNKSPGFKINTFYCLCVWYTALPSSSSGTPARTSAAAPFPCINSRSPKTVTNVGRVRDVLRVSLSWNGKATRGNENPGHTCESRASNR